MKKIYKFRNTVDSYIRKSVTESLALGYIKNLVDEFGTLTLSNNPFSFTLYRKDDDIIYKHGDIEDVVDLSHSTPIMNLIETFKNDIEIDD